MKAPFSKLMAGICCFALFFTACKQDEPEPVVSEVIVPSELNEVLFKVYSLSEDSLLISFPNDGKDYRTQSVSLWQGEEQLLTQSLQENTPMAGGTSAGGSKSAYVVHPFGDAEYTLTLDTRIADSDTISRYTIGNFTHQWQDHWQLNKLATIDLESAQMIGGQVFYHKISPSGQYLYYIKLVPEWASGGSFYYDSWLYRMDLSSGAEERLAYHNQRNIYLVGFAAEEQLVIAEREHHLQENADTYHYILYDNTTEEQRPLVQSPYKRFSNVYNGHFLYYDENQQTMLLNIENGVQQLIPENPYGLLENKRVGNLYMFNTHVYNFESQAFEPVAPTVEGGAGRMVAHHDNETQRSITIETYSDNEQGHYAQLSIFEKGRKVVESGFEKRFIELSSISDEQIIVQQYYDYGTTFNVDGFYSFDPSDGSLHLEKPALPNKYVITELHPNISVIIGPNQEVYVNR